jgi:pimeloyl-ACP methyl ester carboxylesterase
MSLSRRTLSVAGTQSPMIEAGPSDASEAVVFVHGNPGASSDWTALVEAAGELGRAVAFDLPGFGGAKAPAGFGFDVPAYAEFIESAREALGIERVHLVLHDFGGPIGLAWMSANLDRVASITLMDIGLLPGYSWHRLARIWRTPVLGELFMAIGNRSGFRWALARDEPKGLPREFMDRMYDQYDKRTRRAVLDLYRSVDDPGAGARELAALLAPRDLPALVIWGKGDVYLPSAYAERQKDAFPSADVHVLPDSGHWPFADAPETVERLLVEFLRARVGESAPAS